MDRTTKDCTPPPSWYEPPDDGRDDEGERCEDCGRPAEYCGCDDGRDEED